MDKRAAELAAIREPAKCGIHKLVVGATPLKAIEIRSDVPCDLEWMLDDDGVLLIRVVKARPFRRKAPS